MILEEYFLHHCWKYKLINFDTLYTSKGEKIIVHDTGMHNTNEGPDFIHAKIEIAGVVWFGSVEVHVKSSDWDRHKHDENKNYQTVVLHLVYEMDEQDERNNIPVVELKNHISKEMIDRYTYWRNFKKGFIPCEKEFSSVNQTKRNLFLESVFLERLEQKTQIIETELYKNQYDWESIFFRHFSYAMGLRVNATSFYHLAVSIPFSLVQKSAKNQWDMEALLFGQGGFLDEVGEDEYQKKLKEIYGYYKHKYRLENMNNEQFKFFRLYPSGFPTIRIAQLAAIYKKGEPLFSYLMQIKSRQAYYAFFESIKTADYWETHYKFGKESKDKLPKKLTKNKIDLLLINVVLPFKFAYQKIMGDGSNDEVLDIMNEILPENNTIIKQYKKVGHTSENALQTQALLQLNKYYCAEKKCLTCSIGIEILKTENK